MYFISEKDIKPRCPFGENPNVEVKENKYLIKLCPIVPTKNWQTLNAAHINLYPESFVNSQGEHQGITISVLNALEPYMKFRSNNTLGPFNYVGLSNDVRDGLYQTVTLTANTLQR